MSKNIILIMVALGFILGACAGLPSVCDNKAAGPSLLCEVAEKAGVRLEDVGNILIIANAVAIGEGVYTADDAIKVLKELRVTLDSPVSYNFFREALEDKLARYPGLFIVAESYVAQFNSPQVMYSRDRAMLLNFLDARIRGLGGE